MASAPALLTRKSPPAQSAASSAALSAAVAQVTSHALTLMSLQQPLEPSPPPVRSPRADAERAPKHRRCFEDSAEERSDATAAEAKGCCGADAVGEGRWLQPRPVFDRSLILAPMVSACHCTHANAVLLRAARHKSHAQGPSVHPAYAAAVSGPRRRLC